MKKKIAIMSNTQYIKIHSAVICNLLNILVMQLGVQAPLFLFCIIL